MRPEWLRGQGLRGAAANSNSSNGSMQLAGRCEGRHWCSKSLCKGRVVLRMAGTPQATSWGCILAAAVTELLHVPVRIQQKCTLLAHSMLMEMSMLHHS